MAYSCFILNSYLTERSFCHAVGDVSVGIKCDANIISNKEEDVDFDIIPNANDTITVKYIPPGAGRLTIKVLFTDQVSEITH